MCWSGEASAALATVGFGTAGYVAYKGESKELWIPLLSIALCVSVIKSPLRKFLHVRRWLFYDRLEPFGRDVPWFADNLQEPCAETASED